MYKTTKKDFELFKKSCNKYIKKFGLADWDLVFEFKNLGNRNAQSAINAYDHDVTIGLATGLDDTFDRQISRNGYIDYLAKHEVTHVLLADLAALADSRFVQKDELVTCEEALVRRLCKLL